MDGLAELDAMRYELEQAHRRAGGLARSEDLVLKKFGQNTHSSLTDLIHTLGQTERELREQREFQEPAPVSS